METKECEDDEESEKDNELNEVEGNNFEDEGNEKSDESGTGVSVCSTCKQRACRRDEYIWN